jgi:dephospho-CoA kinase
MNWTRLEKIRALQLPDAEKRRRADFVIPTGGSIGQTRLVVRRIIAACMADALGG